MNYQKIYNNLIEKARKENRNKEDGYYESHHILPRSMGGTDEKFNLVLLTPREHYIAHALLVKITEGSQAFYKMAQAFILMGGRTQTQNKRNNSRLYEKCKKEISKSVSKAHRGTLIVKDAKTGIRIGRVRKDHPKVLSGEWYFFTKE
jgi:hypothetical protein